MSACRPIRPLVNLSVTGNNVTITGRSRADRHTKELILRKADGNKILRNELVICIEELGV